MSIHQNLRESHEQQRKPGEHASTDRLEALVGPQSRVAPPVPGEHDEPGGHDELSGDAELGGHDEPGGGAEPGGDGQPGQPGQPGMAEAAAPAVGSDFEPPTEAGPSSRQAPPDDLVTRLLCAAAYLRESVADRVAGDLIRPTLTAMAPLWEVDSVRLVQHARRARSAR